MDAPVTAADGNQRGDARIAPCPRKRGGTRRRRTARIDAAFEDTLLVDRFEAEGSQFGDTGIELSTREGTRRGDNGNAIAGLEGARFAHGLREPRHLGSDRLMLVAAKEGPQRSTTQWQRTWWCQKALLDAALSRERVFDPFQRQYTLLD